MRLHARGPAALLPVVAAVIMPAGLLASACDKEPTKPSPATEPSARASADGVRVDLAAPDPGGSVTAALSGKKVAGETISVVASRDAKMPKVPIVIAAIAAAKPKAIVVKTMKRDRTTAEIPVSLDRKAAACSAVGYIAKDSAINAWPASGATAARYSRGMAGPDLTRGSEGIRKVMAKCDSDRWFVSADAGVSWGLVVDLVLAVGSPEDGGAPKARDVVVLDEATVGRKVETE